MSWVVQNLLKNKTRIRESHDIESDEFNDLLVVERQIDLMKKSSLLTDFDMFIINSMSDGKSLTDLDKVLNLSRITISKLFKQLCDRISYYLGGSFTDEGLINEMTEKYKLSEEEISKLQKYITGNLKHKLMRKHNKNVSKK